MDSNDNDIDKKILLAIFNNNDLLLETAKYSNIEPLILKTFLQKRLNTEKSEIYEKDEIYNDNFDEVVIHIDGGSRGNPGEAGIGIVIEDKNGRNGYYYYIGVNTNNEAEYKALIKALYIAVNENYKNITLFSDSELITKQIKGEYGVKNGNLIKLYYDAKNLISKFDKFKISHIAREKNADADRLANIAIDKKDNGQIMIKL